MLLCRRIEVNALMQLRRDGEGQGQKKRNT